MRRPIGLVSAWLGAAFLMTGPAASGADAPARSRPAEVVMKSLDTKLMVDGRLVDTRRRFLTYQVEQVRGDWLWLVSYEGLRGWAHRNDVVAADRAIAYFSEVIAREPGSAQAYRMRGLAHAREREYRRAFRDAGAAIRLDPKMVPAYLDRSHARLEKFDVRGALADANEAIRLEPGSPRAYGCRAYILSVVKGQYEKAQADLDTAIRLDPADPLLRLERAICWHHQEDDDRAIADATEAIRLDPTLTRAYGLRAEYRADRKDRRGRWKTPT